MQELIRDVQKLKLELERQKSQERSIILRVSSADVSNPPTDAELDTAFGAPSTLPDGFMAYVDDNGAGTAVWLVGAVNSGWWYELLTKAV